MFLNFDKEEEKKSTQTQVESAAALPGLQLYSPLGGAASGSLCRGRGIHPEPGTQAGRWPQGSWPRSAPVCPEAPGRPRCFQGSKVIT